MLPTPRTEFAHFSNPALEPGAPTPYVLRIRTLERVINQPLAAGHTSDEWIMRVIAAITRPEGLVFQRAELYCAEVLVQCWTFRDLVLLHLEQVIAPTLMRAFDERGKAAIEHLLQQYLGSNLIQATWNETRLQLGVRDPDTREPLVINIAFNPHP